MYRKVPLLSIFCKKDQLRYAPWRIQRGVPMQDLIPIKPQDIAFFHADQFFVLGKQDGPEYLIYPAIPILGQYFKTTVQSRYFPAYFVGEKRKENLVGYACDILPNYGYQP